MAKQKLLSFFKQEKKQVIFTGHYMEVFIPSTYFDGNKNAKEIGDRVETLGIFYFKVYDKDKKNPKTYFNNFSSMIETVPAHITHNQTKKIKGLEDNFSVLSYYTGDTFITSTDVIQKSAYTTNFIKLLNAGKLPSNIPYEEYLDLILNNLKINRTNLNVPSSAIELVISELCRDKDDLTKSFRYKAGNPNTKDSSHGYNLVNITTIPGHNSTFTAISFQDIDFSMVNAVNKAKRNSKESISPIEKTIKY